MTIPCSLRIILTIIAVIVVSQVWGSDKFYAHILKAENAVCSGRLHRAVRNYDRAYRTIGVGMPSTTLYNFFVASIDAKRYTKARKLLVELKQRGWVFEGYHSYFARYYEPPEMKILDRLYVEAEVTERSTIDRTITRKVDSIVEHDQRVDNYRYTLEEGSAQRRLMDDSFATLTKSNLIALTSMFVHYFPSDRELGRAQGPFSGPPYHVILMHATETAPEMRPLDSIFFQAAVDKKLLLSDFETYVSMEPKVHGKETSISIGNLSIALPLNPYSFAMINDSLFRFPTSRAKIDSCNVERKKVRGLYNCENLNRRIVFQYYNPKYKFTDMTCITRFDFALPERTKKLLVYVPSKS